MNEATTLEMYEYWNCHAMSSAKQKQIKKDYRQHALYPGSNRTMCGLKKRQAEHWHRGKFEENRFCMKCDSVIKTKNKKQQVVKPILKNSRKDTQVSSQSVRINAIANQMMRGFVGGHKRVVTKEETEKFKKRHLYTIEWVDAHLSKEISVGVHGAVGKAVLWYGVKKIEPFCNALTKGLFNGMGDPAHALYLYLMGRARYNPIDAYRRTITAIRAYIDGRQMVRQRDGQPYIESIKPASSDVFDWGDNYTKMIRRKWTGVVGQNKNRHLSQSEYFDDENETKIAAEVEEAIKELEQDQ